MQLSIVTTSAQQIFDVAWVEINTQSGNLIVQEGHAPTIVILKPQSEIGYGVNPDEYQGKIMIANGICEITRTSVSIIKMQ